MILSLLAQEKIENGVWFMRNRSTIKLVVEQLVVGSNPIRQMPHLSIDGQHWFSPNIHINNSKGSIKRSIPAQPNF